jgi:VanZ family protein
VKTFITYWLPTIVYAGVIFIQSSYPTPHVIPQFAMADKMIHTLVYAGLGALLVRAFAHHWPPSAHGKLALCLGLAGSIVYGALDEWHQLFVETRVAETGDFIADLLGSLCGAFLYWLMRLYFRPKWSR